MRSDRRVVTRRVYPLVLINVNLSLARFNRTRLQHASSDQSAPPSTIARIILLFARRSKLVYPYTRQLTRHLLRISPHS